MPAASRSKRQYHHGALRAALIEAGLAIVERGGVQALSLRAVARQAAVSHSAPYHHFAGKSELLAAVAAAGFDRLVQTIDQVASAATPRSQLDGLRAIGSGYVQFALANPGVFRLMFRPELTRPAEHPMLVEAEARAFDKLLTTIVACQAAGELPGRDPRPLAAACWSTVHGLAVLHVEQVLDETPLGEMSIAELAGYAVEAVTVGVIHTTPPSPQPLTVFRGAGFDPPQVRWREAAAS
jgi:AcrR family transcriptional regulator